MSPPKQKPQRPYPGEIVEVQSRVGGHPLPLGLQDGDEVKLLKRRDGHWQVSKEGEQFTIETINIKDVHRFNTLAAPPPRYQE